MIPVKFPQANTVFGPPSDLEEPQCHAIPAFVGVVSGGSCDGARQIVTAWLPTPQELELLKEGKPVFFSCLGGLPPHYLSTSFEQATHPA